MTFSKIRTFYSNLNLKLIAFAIGIFVLYTGGLTLVVMGRQAPVPVQPASLMATPTGVVLEMPPLPEFTDALLRECGGAGYSEGLYKVQSERMQRAATRWLKGIAQHAFVALPCLETRMGTHKTMTSSAGALGISQLMPNTAKAEAVRCGYGQITNQDLMDPDLNLNIGACHFAALVEQHGLEIAPCMYNGGQSAEACKLAKKFVPGGHKETLGYMAVHSMIMFRFLTNAQKTQKTPAKHVAKAAPQEDAK